MADGKVKISELSQALQLNDNAVFPYTQDNGGTDTTFKAPMTQIARKINEDMDYTNLETSSKKVVGAINQTVNNFAEVYDLTSTYNQNDPVLYDGTLYKCIANNVTGAWDSTKWDEAKAVEFGSGGGGASYATELPISSTDPTDTKSYIDTKTTLVKSASGDLITITDGGDNIPLKSCEVTIDPDLTGKTECNLVVCNKNLYAPTTASQSAGGITCTNNNDGTYTCSNQATQLQQFSLGTIKLPAGTYVLSGCPIGGSSTTFDLRWTNSYIDTGSGVTITSDGNTTSHVVITIRNGYNCGSGITFKPMICKVDTPNPDYAHFEKKSATTYTTTFGTTVYGGEGDVLSGEFISDMLHIDMGTLSWNYSSASNAFYAQLSGASSVVGGDTRALCEGYTIGNKYNTLNDGEFIVGDKSFSSANSCLIVRDDSFSGDSVSFKASVNGKYVVYTATTPTILSLTPVNPKTISGINNIYNDCGSTEIEYFTESADEESELFDVKTGGGYKIQPIVYSTEEREVGVWLDGKPLYQKSFQFSEALSVSYSSWTNTAISKTDYDTIIRAQCSTLDGSFIGEVLVNIPSGSDYLQLQTTRNGSNISAKYLTIYYTKLSDTAGSGQWTPQGVPAHHYSTNEQIVGTWIDGKPLYEKTIDFGALPNTTTKSVNHNISNLDKVAFLNGVAYKSGDIIPIPFSHSGNVSNQTQLSIGNTTVNIRTANDQSDRTGYITVRYTKSS